MRMEAVVGLLVVALFSFLLPTGDAQCNSPYDITTNGVMTTAPGVDKASQGVPWFPELENTKSFQLKTGTNARMLLAPSSRIPPGDMNYIQIEFEVTGSDTVINIGAGTSSGSSSQTFSNLVTSTGYTDFSITVTGGNSLKLSKDGTDLVPFVGTASLPDVKFILVQTNTNMAADTANWKFCENVLMKLGPTTAKLIDGDPTSCEMSMTESTSNWLRVDLDSIYEVKAVLLNDGNGGAATDLGNAEVKIGSCDDTKDADPAAGISIINKNSLCDAVDTTEADGMDFWIFKECSNTGQFVYIITSTTTQWSLCELEVWGIPSTNSAPMLSFSEPTSSALESVSSRTISVIREGDTSSCAYFNLGEVTGSPDAATKDDDFSYTATDLIPTPEPHSFDPDGSPIEFTITVADDADLEPDETFGFELIDLEGAEAGTNPAITLTIQDDEVCYSWESATYSVLENVGTATPVLTRGGYTGGASKACVMTDFGSATSPAATADDITVLPTLTEVAFEEDDMQINVEVQITNDECMKNTDGTNDFGENFQVKLEANCGGVATPMCTGGLMETEITIENDDALHRFQTVSSESVSETDTKVTVVVEREGVTVDDSPAISVQSQPGPSTGQDVATPVDDYSELDTQVTIPAGLTTASFDVIVVDDKIVEVDEKFSILLGTNLDACAVDQAKNSQEFTIKDNDCFYSIDGENDDGDTSVVQKEISEGGGQIELTINCERDDNIALAHSGYVDVNIAQVTGKTAKADEDFDSTAPGSPVRVYFTPGSYSVEGNTGKDTATLSIDIYNDNVVEETTDEMFEATLVDSSGEFRGATKAEITVTDNDAVIALQETSVTVRESEKKITVVLDRQGDQSGTDSVRLISRSSSATPGSSANDGDYMSINEVFTFNDGDETATFQITIFDDDDVEPDESFIVSVVPVNTQDLIVDPEKNELTVIIKDDDCLFTLEVDDDQLVVSENNQPSISVTVRRSGFKDRLSTITLKTGRVSTPILSRDDATPNADYVSLDEELVFQSGDDEHSATINILNDDYPELSEVFMLYLEDPQCDIDGASRKVFTILDDDEIVIKMADTEERVNENAGEAVITLVRTGPMTEEDTVSISVTPGSVGGSKSATPGADYGDMSYTATFEANSGDASVSIPIFDDKIQEESPETFVVSIGTILGSDSSAKVTPNEDERKTVVYIDDNDDVYNLKESSVRVSESTGSYTTYVERVGSASSLGTVYVYTRDGSATSPGDYSPVQATLSLQPGAKSSDPITIEINNDKIEEASKTFVLILASEDGSIIGRSVTSFTIEDDDFPISFKDSDSIIYVSEGDSVTITVQRTRSDYGRPGETAKVSVISREIGSAESQGDFDGINEELVFSAFGTEADFTLTVHDDDEREEEERFELYLSNPSPSNTHYITYPNVLTVYIIDDDGGAPDGGDGGGDGGGGGGDGTGNGDSGGLSQVAVILIGGGVGLVVLLAVLGMIGFYVVSSMGSSAAAAPAAAPPAYSPSAAYYPQRAQPLQFSAQSRAGRPSRSYNNNGYRY